MKSRKPLPDTTDTTPKIRYVTRGYQLVSIVLDVSKSDDKVCADTTKNVNNFVSSFIIIRIIRSLSFIIMGVFVSIDFPSGER